MDYHAIHGYDRASFDTPGTHRLPTISASQALDDLGSDASTHVSTGIEGLDRSLLGSVAVESQDAATEGGVQRGQVTEVWGPPGTGKTALGLQLTANALCDDDAVVWIDCFQPLQPERLRAVTKAVKARRNEQSPSEVDTTEAQESDAAQLYQYSCFTLPHLVSLVSRPTAKLIPANTSLVVIDSFSALVNSALPKSHDGKSTSKSSKGVFLAGLQKVNGRACQEAVENIVAFKVEPDGIAQVPYEALQTFELAQHKRKFGETELEVPDSEDDEDYGWADEDEAAMPAPPPQWQGSEDLILGQDVGQSEEENSEPEEPGTDDESNMK
ncbi:hypothetical protein NW768_004468 [Fusarium equiseti]|uniref:RecA family profile 1 domain-containing protein n=1 Tax=Fusarium equiseti TaxID=61235 RepID=A0ABQ8RGD1_FUSEQ|nr:hypothetical protein NW768_004468 [Fusarium equiseti]